MNLNELLFEKDLGLFFFCLVLYFCKLLLFDFIFGTKGGRYYKILFFFLLPFIVFGISNFNEIKQIILIK